jgi:uncharacterized membrane protein YjgN (DUF898 family)
MFATLTVSPLNLAKVLLVIGAIVYIVGLVVLIPLVYRAWFQAEKFQEEYQSKRPKYGIYIVVHNSAGRILLRVYATGYLLSWIVIGVVAIILVFP